ncbi:microtubule-associated protein Asp [Volvox carteri f. nagariensis]|uniref:Microtubule-associated protein Asp n=1 Tax=Volvox carteri f. nagariensis TaxID=3068 RepID=D8UIV3_VOLCA|nr:microtubule-associated protein Asp [Volvox carteri f. nagariensis]EFJ40339.1 microtubule-associated protein Asp [Volvox carteri f. nagariensis]|eukprot:XP_002958602.1 microtubule-associated protein Asp [Volvox carteri f. nagariensis]
MPMKDNVCKQVLMLEKLPAGISLHGDNGCSLGSVSVPRRSSMTLHVSWRPDSAAVLNETLRWRMAEGLRQARLEVRLQGIAASEPPTSARSSRNLSSAAVKPADARGPNKQPAASSSTFKAPPRTLTLCRPSMAAAASGLTQAHTAMLEESPLSTRLIEPAGFTPQAPALAATKPSPTPPSASPQLAAGVRAQMARPTATTPTRICSLVEQSKALDFRRVGCVESKRERALISWLNRHVVRRLLGEVSGKAYVYFKRDEGFAAMASKIESKIAAKQLTIRDAEHTLSDVRMRQQALDVLTSYHPFWLAVGLQTVLGRALVLSHGNMLVLMRTGGEVPSFIRTHLIEHFLADQDLASQFRHIAFKQDYWEALGARVLGRVLLLVLLLDRMAQRHDLPSGTPSLFRQDANIKSSEQVAQEFLQPRLAGAGDVRHSLRMMSYTTGFVQHARDEADYRVRKPLDLRDGTRLAKLFDNLRRQDVAQTGNSSKPTPNTQANQCSASAAPCNSRIPAPGVDLLPSMAFPQNTGRPMDESLMRNNCLRLVRALQQHGIGLQGLALNGTVGLRDPGLDGVAKLIADGILRLDQKITLGVLWQLAMHYKLRRHVDARSLEREAARLRRATGQAAAFDEAALSRYSDPASQALLQWVRVACAPYGVNVNDFSWSLSDGRVLCYLVNAYMPELLPRDSITSLELPSSADEMARLTGGTEYVKLGTLLANGTMMYDGTLMAKTSRIFDAGWAAVYEMGGAIHDDVLATAYKRSVEANYAAAHAAGEALGVPVMLSADDYLNDGPDELAAILYVSLLAEALLKLTSERRAAYVIMEFLRRRLSWRPSYMHASLEQFKAAMRQRSAVLTIQTFWRMRQQRHQYMALRRAACIMQAFSHRWLVQMRLRKQKHATILLQAAWRGHMVRSRLQRERHAVIAIQTAWRGYTVRRDTQRLLNATLIIQRHVRNFFAHSWRSHKWLIALQQNAARKIQAAWRGYVARRCFQLLRASALVAQTSWRTRKACERYHLLRQAILTIQAAWRMRQAYVRGHLARREALTRLESIVRIQVAWRALQARRLAAALRLQVDLSIENHAACKLQAVVRGHLLRQQLSMHVRAAVVIQAFWRMASARRQHEALCTAAVTIQTAVRCLYVQHHAATTIQCFWRRRSAVLELRTARMAAIAIQAAWRARRERSCFLAWESTRKAASIVQGIWRCTAARREMARRAEAFYSDLRRQQEERLLEIARHFMLRSAAAKRIQAWYRGHLARKTFNPIWKRYKELACQQRAAIVIQSAWRGYVVHIKYCRIRWAVEVINSILLPIFRARRELALLRRLHRARVQAAITLQKSSARPKVQEARCRLEQAAREARKAPHRHIGNRTREALDSLLRPNRNLPQVLAAVEVLEVSTRYSRDCCKLIAQDDGVTALLRFVRSCNRSKPHIDVLIRTLAALHNICSCPSIRYDTFVPDVFHAEECLAVLSERLQYFRDTEEVFNTTVTLLQRLTATEDLAANVPAAVLRHWEGIHQVLFRKADIERKYLERLEGQKGSDVSARESARKLVIVQQQVQALEVLISRACDAVKDEGALASDLANDQDKDGPSRRLGFGKPGPLVATGTNQGVLPIPGLKNTLVKNVVQRLATGGTATGAVRTAGHSGGGAISSPVQPGKGRTLPRRMDAQKMSEPVGLSMSLDDLIKKRSQTSRGGVQAIRGGRGGGGLGVRAGGVSKFSERKSNGAKPSGDYSWRQQQHTQQHRAQGFGGRHGIQKAGFQQRRGGFGGRGGFGERQQYSGATSSVHTYLDDNTGNVVVKLKDTEVVTISPSGVIILTTGGWFTQTTLDVMNKALGVLQIRVTATGDVRDGTWQVAYGPHLLRFYDGIILHPKNPATAAQRAPMVLAAMNGAPAATAGAGVGVGAASYASGLMLPSTAAGMAPVGTNPLAASAAAASTAAALAAGVMARARAALGMGSSSAFGGMSDVAPTQQQLALAALAAQQNQAFSLHNITDHTPTDSDAIRRLKAQGRL